MKRKYLLQRSLHSIVLLLLAILLAFLLLRLAPGDPAVILLGGQASTEAIAQLREVMGLNRSWPEQFVAYLVGVLRGDLGVSIRTQTPVLAHVIQRVPASIELLIASLSISMIIGVLLGIMAAVRHRSLVDYSVITLSLLGQSIPGFWLGLMLIVVFSVRLHWLPPAGRESLLHLVLPAVTLAAFFVGLFARLTRATLLEVMDADYIRTARSKGLSEQIVIGRHALRNALMPLVTVLGLQVGTLLGGAVVTETVFAWPGMGSLAVQAIYQRDYPLVQGIVLISAIAFIGVNFAVDILYSYLDPRVAYD